MLDRPAIRTTVASSVMRHTCTKIIDGLGRYVFLPNQVRLRDESHTMPGPSRPICSST